MPEFNCVADLLDVGQTALCLFTRGLNLQINQQDGTGSTGAWKVGVNRQFDTVILCHRQGNDSHDNIVFEAQCTDYEGPNAEGRYILHLARIKNLGSTASNWIRFAGGGQNPVRYFTKE